MSKARRTNFQKEHDETYMGVGVSSGRSGRATGSACVCKSLSEASKIEKGQILVVEHTQVQAGHPYSVLSPPL